MKAIRTSILFLLLAGCDAGGGTEEATAPERGEETLSAPTTDSASKRLRAPVRLRSDAEVVEALRGRLSRSTRGLARERRADGLQTIRFGGRFGHATLIKRMPDGSLRRSCVDNVRAAREFLSGKPAPAIGTAPAAGETR
jgi:hypothetical protein